MVSRCMNYLFLCDKCPSPPKKIWLKITMIDYGASFCGLAGLFCWVFLDFFIWLHSVGGLLGLGLLRQLWKLVVSLHVVFHSQEGHAGHFHRVKATFQEVIPNRHHIFWCPPGKAIHMTQARVPVEGTSQEP